MTSFHVLQELWTEKYKVVPEQLNKLKQIPAVATAFNANIDAIIKIKGDILKHLIEVNGLGLKDIANIKSSSLNQNSDVLLGIVKCFSRGIAEEWITDDVQIYHWMEKNLGYDHLQMGGQGGIIANALALLGVKKVIAHTNSHPKLQSEQFLNLANLFGFNQKHKLEKAYDIIREDDIPLVHWIIEFDKGDSFTIEGQTFTCPKSNRFIATYDPLNMKLVMDDGFINYLNSDKVSYLLLSGFHALIEKNDGAKLIKKAVPILKKWQEHNKNMMMHLEIASTQDKVVRKAIADEIAPLCQSVGLNERETVDLLEIYNQKDLALKIEKDTNSKNLFEAILYLKKKLNVKRIQLHMFGLYLTIIDKDFEITPEQSLKGMMTASVVSSSKAANGELAHYDDVTKSFGTKVSEQGLRELSSLAEILSDKEFIKTGITEVEDFYVIALPTILIDKPKTLVGMGDTISSVSLLAAR